MSTAIHCVVSGRVQGVFFRASTQREARRLKLNGWVRNLADGRVEVYACGDSDALLQLQIWLQHGPDIAKVTDMTCEAAPFQDHDDFRIR